MASDPVYERRAGGSAGRSPCFVALRRLSLHRSSGRTDPRGGFDPSQSIPSPADAGPGNRGAGRIHAAVQWIQSDRGRHVLWQAASDAAEGAARVARATRMPTRKGVLDFLSYQLLVNCIAWTAGLIASSLVTHFFEVKGFRNLWGLAASGSRTPLSAGDYRLVMTVTSFCVGLTMMILVRHFILRWIDEVRSLRRDREGVEHRPLDPDTVSLRSCVADVGSLDVHPDR